MCHHNSDAAHCDKRRGDKASCWDVIRPGVGLRYAAMESRELEPRPAATVVLMRPSPAGLQVLLLRRNSQLAFFGGAWVFPGGRIDDSDGPPGDLAARARTAAARELREEAGLAIDPQALVHFAQWITPPGQARRFDTWYFAACAPSGTVQVDAGEVQDHRWMTPDEALGARALGQIELPPPTFVTLTQLAAHDDPADAGLRLAAGPVVTYAPRPCAVSGGRIYLYEGDAGFELRDPELPGTRHRLLALETAWTYVVPD
jgi:8-oxo-dGTP pyrophosphatase MutT (NUDIX family)